MSILVHTAHSCPRNWNLGILTRGPGYLRAPGSLLGSGPSLPAWQKPQTLCWRLWGSRKHLPALRAFPPGSYLSHELHYFSSGAGCRPESWASTCRRLEAWGRAGVLGERASPGQGLLILETPQGALRAAGGKGDSWPARLGGGSPTLRLVTAPGL